MPDKDVVRGKAKQIEGKVDSVVGNLADDPVTEAKGVAKRIGGKIQEEIGHARDDVRDAAAEERARREKVTNR